MRVVAIRRGLFGGAVYEPGEEFNVPDEVMTAKRDVDGHPVPPRWFKEVEPEKVEPEKVEPEKVEE